MLFDWSRSVRFAGRRPQQVGVGGLLAAPAGVRTAHEAACPFDQAELTQPDQHPLDPGDVAQRSLRNGVVRQIAPAIVAKGAFQHLGDVDLIGNQPVGVPMRAPAAGT